jgi:uncharacterized protein (DUF58 family)
MPLHPKIDDLLELRHQAHTVGLASHHAVNSMLCGLYRSVFRGQGMDFEEVREYREGDEIRNMDWRVTARTGTPYLKVFREERERTVVLCIDVGPHMQFGTRGTFKSIQAARAAALLGWAAYGNQDRVGALLFGNPAEPLVHFTPSRARRSLWRVLNALTREPESTYDHRSQGCGDCLVEALERVGRSVKTGALVFCVGDFNRDPTPLEEPLGRLIQRHDVVLLPVDDPADRELPAIGRVIFSAADGSQVEVDTDSSDGRLRYREAWEAQRRHLVTMARRLSADVLPVPTDKDVHQTLLTGLRLRARHLVTR